MKQKAPTAEQIKAAREKAALTQEAAASLIGYTRRAWQQWEAGNRGMRRTLFDLFMDKVKQNG